MTGQLCHPSGSPLLSSSLGWTTPPPSAFPPSSGCRNQMVSQVLWHLSKGNILGQVPPGHLKEQRAGTAPWPGGLPVIHSCIWFPGTALHQALAGLGTQELCPAPLCPFWKPSQEMRVHQTTRSWFHSLTSFRICREWHACWEITLNRFESHTLKTHWSSLEIFIYIFCVCWRTLNLWQKTE